MTCPETYHVVFWLRNDLSMSRPVISMFALDYLHAVIKEVSEAEERNMSSDDLGAQAAGSSEDLEGEGVGITFTARKASSKLFYSLFFSHQIKSVPRGLGGGGGY